MKLCVVSNIASIYRKPIYSLIDKEWDCIWRFGLPENGIKAMDLNVLQDAKIVSTHSFPGGWTWQRGIVGLLRNDEIHSFLLLGELFSLSTWMLIILRRLIAPQKNIYFWSHGWYGREGFLKKWMKRVFFGFADKTFLYGNYARQVAIQQGNNPDKLVVIHNSLDYENQTRLRESLHSSDVYYKHFNNHNPTLIFIGRLTKGKKLHQLLYAVAMLKECGVNFNVVFVGDGTERAMLEGIACKKDLSVWFYGACYDDKVNADLIYNADLCISPGNVGLTAVHSMTFGTPVLTHSNFPYQGPEFEAITDGKTGAFFKEDDIESLANAIENWFSKHSGDRDIIRQYCYEEIAESWTPNFQMNKFRKHIII